MRATSREVARPRRWRPLLLLAVGWTTEAFAPPGTPRDAAPTRSLPPSLGRPIVPVREGAPKGRQAAFDSPCLVPSSPRAGPHRVPNCGTSSPNDPPSPPLTARRSRSRQELGMPAPSDQPRPVHQRANPARPTAVTAQDTRSIGGSRLGHRVSLGEADAMTLDRNLFRRPRTGATQQGLTLLTQW